LPRAALADITDPVEQVVTGDQRADDQQRDHEAVDTPPAPLEVRAAQLRVGGNQLRLGGVDLVVAAVELALGLLRASTNPVSFLERSSVASLGEVELVRSLGSRGPSCRKASNDRGEIDVREVQRVSDDPFAPRHVRDDSIQPLEFAGRISDCALGVRQRNGRVVQFRLAPVSPCSSLLERHESLLMLVHEGALRRGDVGRLRR
jgi:hypothetical protein